MRRQLALAVFLSENAKTEKSRAYWREQAGMIRYTMQKMGWLEEPYE